MEVLEQEDVQTQDEEHEYHRNQVQPTPCEERYAAAARRAAAEELLA